MSLNNGTVDESALPRRSVAVKSNSMWGVFTPVSASLELLLRPDPSIWDGRFANNGWLQELPKPITKLTWDNAALVSPATAGKFTLQNEDVVELSIGGRKLEAPVWIVPGQPDEVVTLHVGYGRVRAGRVGSGVGVNAYALRSAEGGWSSPGLEIRKTGKRYTLACTQDHSSMEGRELVRYAPVQQFLADPAFARKQEHQPGPGESLYPQHEYDGYAWGMSIDLNACTGCNACVVACQSENNIPIVGKEQVHKGREMHWIRIDRYFEGDLDAPEIHTQPVTCMHCENAPCEVRRYTLLLEQLSVQSPQV
jgi:molybdopterin-containing oxidoreductase family iron-sulfur binding subunit